MDEMVEVTEEENVSNHWMRTALFWLVTQRVVVISYRHFEISYRSHLQGFLPILRPETSVRNYHYSLHNNPAERSSHVLRGGSLMSPNYWMTLRQGN
jgi:hypothetical protein